MEALTNFLHSLMNAAAAGDSKRTREIAETCLVWARLHKIVTYEQGYKDGLQAGLKKVLASESASVKAV